MKDMERLFYEKWPRTLPKAGKFTEPKSSSQRCVRSVLLRQEEKQSRAPSHLTNASRNLVKSYESLLHNLMLNSLLGLLQNRPRPVLLSREHTPYASFLPPSQRLGSERVPPELGGRPFHQPATAVQKDTKRPWW